MTFRSCWLICSACLIASTCYSHGNYFGVLVGYGNTNWSKIIASDITLQASLPISTDDGTAVYGVYFGKSVTSWLGFEARYQRFTETKVSFADQNLYDPPSFKKFHMYSDTSNFDFLSRFDLRVQKSLGFFTVIGASYTMRRDKISNLNGLGAVFGFGADYIYDSFRQGIEFDFTTGKAKIDLNPAQGYLPFLTQFSYRVSYLF